MRARHDRCPRCGCNLRGPRNGSGEGFVFVLAAVGLAFLLGFGLWVVIVLGVL